VHDLTLTKVTVAYLVGAGGFLHILTTIRNKRYLQLKKFHDYFNPLNPELNPICYLLSLLEAHHFLHVSRI